MAKKPKTAPRIRAWRQRNLELYRFRQRLYVRAMRARQQLQQLRGLSATVTAATVANDSAAPR